MRIALTGSSSGIGQHLAVLLASEGHQVWGAARSPQDQHPALASGRFQASRVDVSDWNSVAAWAEDLRLRWGSLDAIIACAGLQGEIGPAMLADPMKWSSTVRANLDGTYFTLRALFPFLSREVRAKVICFSGGGATKSRPNFSAYGVAKTGIVRLVETLADEWRDLPIDINAVAPGAIPTRLTDEVIALGEAKAGQAEYASALKLKQAGDAPLAKAVGLVRYLLSAQSDGLTGRLLAAPWDPWATLGQHRAALEKSEIYQLRRVLPEERGQSFDPR